MLFALLGRQISFQNNAPKHLRHNDSSLRAQHKSRYFFKCLNG